MKESGYYPMGAEFDKSAPYNEREVKFQEFDKTFRVFLEVDATIESSDYTEEMDEEYDDDGHIARMTSYEYDGNPEEDFIATYMPISEAIKAVLPFIPADKKLKDAVKTLKMYSKCYYQQVEEA